MPDAFAVPTTPAEPGMTFYRGFSGTGTLFDPKVSQGVGIATITDGTSNTIAVVEAKEAVPWTKPESDLSFENDPKLERTRALLTELGGHFAGGFNALICDGSVRFIRETINPRMLRALDHPRWRRGDFERFVLDSAGSNGRGCSGGFSAAAASARSRCDRRLILRVQSGASGTVDRKERCRARRARLVFPLWQNESGAESDSYVQLDNLACRSLGEACKPNPPGRLYVMSDERNV